MLLPLPPRVRIHVKFSALQRFLEHGGVKKKVLQVVSRLLGENLLPPTPPVDS